MAGLPVDEILTDFRFVDRDADGMVSVLLPADLASQHALALFCLLGSYGADGSICKCLAAQQHSKESGLICWRG